MAWGFDIGVLMLGLEVCLPLATCLLVGVEGDGLGFESRLAFGILSVA